MGWVCCGSAVISSSIFFISINQDWRCFCFHSNRDRIDGVNSRANNLSSSFSIPSVLIWITLNASVTLLWCFVLMILIGLYSFTGKGYDPILMEGKWRFCTVFWRVGGWWCDRPRWLGVPLVGWVVWVFRRAVVPPNILFSFVRKKEETHSQRQTVKGDWRSRLAACPWQADWLW